MKKILFIQSKFDFNQFYDKDILPNSNEIEFGGIKYLNEPPEFFLKYSKIYSCNYCDNLASSIIKKAKTINVETILLMDGIFDWAALHVNPKNADITFDVNIYTKIYCVDNHSASYLKSIGAITGLYKPHRIFGLNLNVDYKKDRLLSSTKKKILLTTSNTPYFNEIEFTRITKIFKSIIEWCKLNSTEIYFRIYNKKILSELNIDGELNLIDGSIETYIKKIDLLITTPSSISATAVMLDKPFIHVIYRDAPISFQAAWQIFSTDMTNEVLKSALSRDKKRMAYQRTIIPQIEIQNFKDEESTYNYESSNKIKYSTFEYMIAIFKSKIKGIYHKIFKHK